MTSSWMTDNISFISPNSSAPLIFQDDCFTAPSTGEIFPIINNIPRFVPYDTYSKSFGLQWNKFRLTQLDSHTRLPLSKDRLTRIAGSSLDIFRNSNVLEAGCGAGRFTEIMLEVGARVWAADLSTAVDANYQNCHQYSSYFICQADILLLPFEPEQFDIVVCIGVIQHTPDPEQTIRILCSHVKPGGTLLLDHYTYDYPMPPTRRFLRTAMLKTPEKFRIPFVKGLVSLLWPIHLASHELNYPGSWRLRRFLLKHSPIVDYQDAYPKLGKRLLYEWSVLDTHDTLTDYYKHFRSADEIASYLKACGMADIKIELTGNGVEAKASKPLVV